MTHEHPTALSDVMSQCVSIYLSKKFNLYLCPLKPESWLLQVDGWGHCDSPSLFGASAEKGFGGSCGGLLSLEHPPGSTFTTCWGRLGKIGGSKITGDGQGGLACFDSWSRRVGHNWATELNWTEDHSHQAGLGIAVFLDLHGTFSSKSCSLLFFPSRSLRGAGEPSYRIPIS